jgi:hypothetical protein
LFVFFFDPEDGADMLLRNVGLTVSGLHGFISQEVELFISKGLWPPRSPDLTPLGFSENCMFENIKKKSIS